MASLEPPKRPSGTFALARGTTITWKQISPPTRGPASASRGAPALSSSKESRDITLSDRPSPGIASGDHSALISDHFSCRGNRLRLFDAKPISEHTCQLLQSSIKGKVKKNTSPIAGTFLAFQPL